MKKIIGLISDTHGLLRLEALKALEGSDIIVHAGDIGRAGIIEELGKIAPVYAIRGNVDKGEWAQKYPDTEVVEFEGIFLYVLHDLNELDLDPVAAGFSCVISGHSHKPKIFEKRGIWYINPGSAGRRRFSLPISVGRIVLDQGEIQANIIELVV